MSDYRPISCQSYAELEVAILHQVSLRVAWLAGDGRQRLEPLRPADLSTRAHEEYLLAEDSLGRQLEIRLDRILRFSPL